MKTIVKPDNVLLSRDGRTAKLCDLGSVLAINEIGVTEYVASRYYRAPEVILGCQFDYQIDMWSLGTTLYEAYTGRVLFVGPSNNEMLKLMMKLKGKFPNWMLRKGQFSHRHFDDRGLFVSHKHDSSSRPVVLCM